MRGMVDDHLVDCFRYREIRAVDEPGILNQFTYIKEEAVRLDRRGRLHHYSRSIGAISLTLQSGWKTKLLVLGLLEFYKHEVAKPK